MIDICNGRDGYHTPDNAPKRQSDLLEILNWFIGWKALHDKNVAAGKANEFHFFAHETWFCIQALILGEVAAMQIYCIQKGERIRPRCMNTDPVEWHFGDIRCQGSTNKMTARTANTGDMKAQAFNYAKCQLPKGNNKSGECHFGRRQGF